MQNDAGKHERYKGDGIPSCLGAILSKNGNADDEKKEEKRQMDPNDGSCNLADRDGPSHP